MEDYRGGKLRGLRRLNHGDKVYVDPRGSYGKRHPSDVGDWYWDDNEPQTLVREVPTSPAPVRSAVPPTVEVTPGAGGDDVDEKLRRKEEELVAVRAAAANPVASNGIKTTPDSVEKKSRAKKVVKRFTKEGKVEKTPEPAVEVVKVEHEVYKGEVIFDVDYTVGGVEKHSRFYQDDLDAFTEEQPASQSRRESLNKFLRLQSELLGEDSEGVEGAIDSTDPAAELFEVIDAARRRRDGTEPTTGRMPVEPTMEEATAAETRERHETERTEREWQEWENRGAVRRAWDFVTGKQRPMVPPPRRTPIMEALLNDPATTPKMRADFLLFEREMHSGLLKMQRESRERGLGGIMNRFARKLDGMPKTIAAGLILGTLFTLAATGALPTVFALGGFAASSIVGTSSGIAMTKWLEKKNVKGAWIYGGLFGIGMGIAAGGIYNGLSGTVSGPTTPDTTTPPDAPTSKTPAEGPGPAKTATITGGNTPPAGFDSGSGPTPYRELTGNIDDVRRQFGIGSQEWWARMNSNN